jgi:hypothetical protein
MARRLRGEAGTRALLRSAMDAVDGELSRLVEIAFKTGLLSLGILR